MALKRTLSTICFEPINADGVSFGATVTLEHGCGAMTVNAAAFFDDIGLDVMKGESLLEQLTEGQDYLRIQNSDQPVVIITVQAAMDICHQFPGPVTDLAVIYFASAIEEMRRDWGRSNFEPYLNYIEVDGLITLDFMAETFRTSHLNNGICNRDILIALLKKDGLVHEDEGLKPAAGYEAWFRTRPSIKDDKTVTTLLITPHGFQILLRKYLGIPSTEALVMLAQAYPMCDKLVSNSLFETRRIASLSADMPERTPIAVDE